MRDHGKMMRAGLISSIRKLAASRKAAPGRRHGRAVRFLTFGEHELREFNRSVLPMRIFDRETLRYLAVNDAALKLYGYTRDEFLALTLKDTRHPEGHAEISPTLAEPTGYLRHWGPRRHVKKSGEVIVVELVSQDIVFNGRKARLGAVIDVTEPKRAQEELSRQKKLLDAIIENLPVGVFIRDAKTMRYLMRNRFSERSFGRTVESSIGKTVYDLFPKEQAELFSKKDREALDSRQMVEITEQEVIGKSGDLRIQHVRKVPVFDGHGQPWMLVGIADDITERKEIERALHESESKYRNLVESSSDLIWSADAEGRITFINQAARRIYGYEPEEMLGRPVTDFLGDGSPKKAFGFFRAMLAAGRSWADYECEVRRKDGEPVVLSSNAIVLRDAEGKRIGVTGISKDITARKRMEAELRQSEERFRQLAENIREVFWINTPAGDHIDYISPGYEEIWGRSRESLYLNPRSWMEPIHPGDLPAVQNGQEKMARGQRTDVDYRIIRPDGTLRWIRDRSYPMKRGDGTRLVCGIAEDITESKQAEARRIADVVRQRDALVREVHHRIKNNLQGVMGLLRQLAADDPLARPVIDKAISQLQAIAVVHGLEARRVRRMIGLRDILLAIGTAVKGTTPAEFELDLGAAEDARAQLAETETVAVALVLNELLLNAARSSESMPKSGGVSVMLRTEAASIRVTISNPGRLPPQFDFAHARGLGTGLELVRSLLPQNGARLTFSEAAGRVNAELEISAPVLVMQRSPALAAQH